MDYISKYTGEQIEEALKKAMDGSVITNAEAATLDAGSEATATIEGNVLKLGIPAGKTPQKGTDYWTADDKAEMVNEVLAALPAAEGVGF